MLRLRSILPALATLLLAGPIAAQDHDHAAGEVVGTVHFSISCAAAQERFDRGMAKLHSFWFDAAHAAFAAAAEADPDCAMAPFGTAMTLWGNPMARSAPSAERTAEAVAAIERARALAADATDRERAWIEAAAALWDDHGTVGYLERMARHEDALRALVEAHPDDVEARIFLARIMVANGAPDDLTFAKQRAAAEILLPLFEARPDHPGLAHYIIHAFDAPPIAEHGLAAAKRYAEIAPAAPHALHMPSHIFTRLGYWDESIETNARSAEAEASPSTAVHPLDYMVYAYLQQGRDAAAGEVLAGLVEGTTDRYYGSVLGYNALAMPARYALERNDWEAAAALPAPDGALAWVEAVPRFARAIGMARGGRTVEARAEVARLAELEQGLAAEGSDWAVRVGAQRLAAEAWVTWAAGDREAALEQARRAAEMEETVEKHPITPGPLLPARELYADMLMEADRPAGAAAAYAATLEREPRRARALYGAGRAAQAAGDPAAAARWAGELLEVMERADAERPEPAWARAVTGASAGGR